MINSFVKQRISKINSAFKRNTDSRKLQTRLFAGVCLLALIITATIVTSAQNRPVNNAAGYAATGNLHTSPALISIGGGLNQVLNFFGLNSYFAEDNRQDKKPPSTPQAAEAYGDDKSEISDSFKTEPITTDLATQCSPSGNPPINVPENYSTIQTAINAADPGGGDTIQVAAGTFQEQLVVNKCITITGAGQGQTIILSPNTLANSDVPNASSAQSIIEVRSGSYVTMSNLTVKGPAAFSSATGYGIFVVENSTLNLSSAAVTDVRENPFAGNQRGLAIAAGRNAFNQIGSIILDNVTVTGYQKGGIIVDRTGSTATINRTTVTGAGLTGVTAQNGIQISRGATGTITNSTVSNNAYNDPSVATATGITPFNAGAISITNNTLINNDAGIYNTVSPLPTPPAALPAFTVSGNTISNTDLTDTYGVILYGSNGNLTNNFISGNNFGVLGFSGDNAVIDIHGNSITGAGLNGSGIDFENYSNTPTVNAQLSANFNRIAGNDYGAYNSTSSNFNAENNFWGCNTGPNTTGCDAAGAVNGNIDFDPYLILSHPPAAQPPVSMGGSATITTNLIFNSAGANTFTPANHLPNPIPATLTSANSPNGIPVNFTATNGTVNPTVTPLTDGLASTTFTGGMVDGGDQTAVVTARVDNAADTVNVTVLDSTPPTVSSANVTSSTANTVTYTVTFSESVTGVDAGDFTVTPTGNVTAMVTSVSADSGNTRTVVVTITSGMGTIQLNVVDNDSIKDTASAQNPLGGTGAGNGNFAGQTFNIDVQMPTVTINQATGQADPTSSSPINFTVVFSEPVTGFGDAPGDVDLSQSTAGGTLTAIVTPVTTQTNNGATYNVVVSGMTTSGTVIASIPANAAADSTNNGNAPSSSTDNSVTYLQTVVTRLRDNVTFPTIQSGIDNVGTINGDTLLASPGVYNERIVVNKELTIQGAQHGVLAKPRSNANAESTIVVDNSQTVPVEIQVDNVTIDGFNFDITQTFPTVNGNDKPGSIIRGVANPGGDGYQNINILNNRLPYDTGNTDVASLNRNGFFMFFANNLTIEGNYFAGFAGQAVIIANGSTNFVYRNNDSYNNADSNIGTQGNFGGPTTTLDHTNVLIENNRSDQDSMILFLVKNSIIRNNTLTAGPLGSSRVYLGGGSSNVSIENNNFALTNNVGIISFDPGFGYGANSNINSIGNTMTRTIDATTTGSFSAIDYRGTSGTNTIANNTVTLTAGTLPAGNSTYAIRLRGNTSGNFNITGNFLNGNGVTSNTAVKTAGLYISSNTPDSGTGSGGQLPASAVINVNCNTFRQFQDGITVYNGVANTTGGLPTGIDVNANGDNFLGNSQFGVNNGGTSETIDAANSYWNSPTGPSGAGPGTGDAVSANVNYTPFLTSPSTCAPINTVPAAQTINQDTTRTFSAANGNQISITDPDVLNNPVTVTLSVTNGTLTLSGTNGLTFTAGDGTADATMTFSGTLANVNAALNGLTFTPNAGFVGTSTLTITSSSMGSPGVGGGTQTDTDTVTINVLDAIAPTVTINQASGQNDPTSTSPINFTVVFSEPVINFATGDVTVTGSAFGPGSTPSAVVTGSGTTYNVAVSGMTRSGTVTASLAAGVASDAQGNPSAASTSTDNTVFFNFVVGTPVNTPESVNPTNVSTPFSLTQFFFLDESSNGGIASGAFVTGPATPPLPIGSARLTIDSNGRENIATRRYAGTRLADISSLQYSAYTNRTDGLTITLQFDVDYDLSDANGAFQSRLVYEPAAQGIPVTANTWQTFDTLAGRFYSGSSSPTNPGNAAGCTQATPCTRQQLLAAFPNVGILGGSGAAFPGAIYLRAGGPFPGGMVANTDNLVVGLNGSATTFNFEPTPPTISIGNATVTEGNSGTLAATFTITQSVVSQLDTTVTVNTADGTATTADNDYQPIVNATATIPAGQTSTTVTILVNGDTNFEPDETFTVKLTNALNAAISNDTGTGTIINDEAARTVSIALTSAGAEPGTPNVFTVTLSGQTASTVTVDYSTANGTAAAGSDYTANSATLTFAANTTMLTQTITVATLDDSVVEPTENFTVNLSNATNAAIGTGSATGTIADNDSTIQFASAIYSSSDNAPNTVTATVTRTGILTNAATVNFATGGGSATGGTSCTAGIDYISTSGTLNFASGVSSRTFNISVCQDSIIEGNETVNLTLSNPTPPASVTLGTPFVSVLTISDSPGGGVSISGVITQNGGGLNGVTVTLTGTNMGTVTTVTTGGGNYSFNGLQSGANYLVTPTLSGFVFEPINRSYVNLTTPVANANFIAYPNNAIPRKLIIGNVTTAPGNPINVPVNLRSLGNENGISFTLDYDESRVTPTNVVCGSGAPVGCAVNFTIQTVSGNNVLVISLDLPNNVFFTSSPPDREAVVISFTTTNTPSTTASFNSPLNFTDNPLSRAITDGQNPLPAEYVNGQIAFNNLESDVAPRQTGDGFVNAGDVAQMRRFVAFLDTPNSTTNNEFQRADSAPIGTLGDGLLNAGDLAQARRYAANLDPLQPAGGPTAPIAPLADSLFQIDKSTSLEKPNGDAAAANTTIRVVNVTSSANSTVLVTIGIDAAGNENALGFSIKYNPSKLSLPSVNPDDDVTLGANAVDSTNTPATLTPNTLLAATTGQIGVLLDFRPNRSIVAGNNLQLIVIRFKVASTVTASEQIPLIFGSTPIQQATFNAQVQQVTTDYLPGNVIIARPTAANISISGRLLSRQGRGVANALITLTNNQGEVRFAHSNFNGNFNFAEIPAGETYTISIRSKQYSFTPQLLNSTEDINKLTFIADQ